MASPRRCVVRYEPDPECAFHCDAVAAALPDATEVDATAGELPQLDAVDGVVLTGSTAGVYEREERPWIEQVEAFLRKLVERSVPTLGICFGHQVANAALGGRVEPADESNTRLVRAQLSPEPPFDDLLAAAVQSDAAAVRNDGGAPASTDAQAAAAAPEDASPASSEASSSAPSSSLSSAIVPALHGDVVTDAGDEMVVIGSTDYCEIFATRHREAPLWTVQFHPELTAEHREHLVDAFEWTDDGHDFSAVEADRVLEQFRSIVEEASR